MDGLFLGLRVIVSLGVIVAAIWFVRRRVTTRGGVARARAVTMVGRQSLGAKNSVAVVDMDGMRFYLGVTEQSISVLHSAEAPAQVFAQELDKAATSDGSELLVTRDIPGLPPQRGALAGSVLSAATWKQALGALRNRA